MRLWHEALIPFLPRQQLLGQHRECCALRGKGWGKPHATVDYVFRHSPYVLFLYHQKVMEQMQQRGYRPNEAWFDPYYRGASCRPWKKSDLTPDIREKSYPEHDRHYLHECFTNLKNKGVELPSSAFPIPSTDTLWMDGNHTNNEA